MSNMAQGRDLSDPKTAEALAANVQTLERLRLLLALTVCDIRAVGPGVWNGWKGQLLRSLFWETEVVLGGGHSSIDSKSRVAAAQEALAPRPCRDGRTPISTPMRRATIPHIGSRSTSAARSPHAKLLYAMAAEVRSLATEVATDAFRGVTEIDHHRARTIRACCRSSPAPAPRRAAISSTRRSSRPPTASRSTRFSYRAPSIATRTNCGAPPGSRGRSNRRCAAKFGSAKSFRAKRDRDTRAGAFAIAARGHDRQLTVEPIYGARGFRASTGSACSTI